MNFDYYDKKVARLFIIAVLVAAMMGLLTQGRFFNIQNIIAILNITPELGILALGTMTAMIVGGIDLSIVSIANLSSIVIAKVILWRGGGPDAVVLGLLCGVLVGLACGYFNGFLVARIGVHPILVTLGSFQLFQGIAIVITKGYAVTNLPESLIYFGQGSILGLPIPFYILLIVWFGISYILQNTGYGQSLYMIGTNFKASKLSALDSDKILHRTYMFVGLIAVAAGLIMVSRTNSAKSDYGASYTLQTILICMLGGVNWSGGIGKPKGIIVSLFILQFLASGFSILRFSNFFRDFTSGVFLLFILVFYFYMDKWDEKVAKEKLNKL